MSGPQVTVERRVAAPAERVWAVLTDIEGSPRVISGIDKVEILSDGPFGVGTRWRETRRMLGKEATEEMWVTESEPAQRYVVEAESRGVRYVSEFRLTPQGGDATSVRLTFGSEIATGGGLKSKLMQAMGSIGAKAAAKALAKDLEDIAASAEASGPRAE